MAPLSLLLVLGFCAAVRSEVELYKRIYGGVNCADTERLYHVALFSVNDPDPVCGGSLISDQWVLTAAHCWENTGLEAVVGIHPNPALGQTMTITHKEIYVDQNHNQHDIMLLKLPKRITTISPVKLPDCKNPLQVGDTVQVAGLGATTAGSGGKKKSDTSPKPLQCADFKVENINLITKSGHVFSLQTNNVDTCPGDSGGGAIHNNMIYGVHVRSGKKVCTKAAKEMDVCKYEAWISQTINP